MNRPIDQRFFELAKQYNERAMRLCLEEAAQAERARAFDHATEAGVLAAAYLQRAIEFEDMKEQA